jgi:hypothetical protein
MIAAAGSLQFVNVDELRGSTKEMMAHSEIFADYSAIRKGTIENICVSIPWPLIESIKPSVDWPT